MECYIKCPPDKSVSLAEGEQFINFEVEQPKTNYDWNRCCIILFQILNCIEIASCRVRLLTSNLPMYRFGTLSSGWYKNSSRILVPGLYIITYTVRDDEDMDIASCRTTVRVTGKII